MRIREMNENEPLMRCRNAERCLSKPGCLNDSGISLERNLLSCPDGNRHIEGMNLIQALIRNLGTCRSDAKRESQAEVPRSERVSMRSTGAESFVVARKEL